MTLPFEIRQRYGVNDLRSVEGVEYVFGKRGGLTLYVYAPNELKDDDHVAQISYEAGYSHVYPDDLRDLPNLKWVSFISESSHKLLKIPDDLFRDTQLETVSIAGLSVDIKALTSSIRETLTELYLDNVDITSLHELDAPHLKKLTCRYCDYEGEEALYLNYCPSLRELAVSNTNMALLPDVQDCTELTALDVQRCDLSNDNLTGYDWSQLTNMRVLCIKDCNIRGELNESFGSMSQLFKLDLGNNQLSGQLPDSFSNLGKVRTLRLDQNQFSGDLVPLSGLRMASLIYIQDNQFEGEIPYDLIEGNRFLNRITAKRNNLSRLPDARSKSKVIVAVDRTVDRNSKYWHLAPGYRDEDYVVYINRQNNICSV